MAPLIQVETLMPGVSAVVLQRPEQRNALSIDLLEQLCTAVEELAAQADQRVVILRGAGPVFSAGLDLREAADDTRVERSAASVRRALNLLQQTPLVSIAAVHGGAYAGGAGLMAACDIVIAAEDSRFGFPEARRGLLPALICAVLRARIREGDLRDLLLTGEIITAARALQVGLVQRVIPAGKLMEEARRVAELIHDGGPETIRRTRQLLNQLFESQAGPSADRLDELHLSARRGDEAREGLAAFAEKRGSVVEPGAITMNSPNDGNGRLAQREKQLQQAEEILGTLPQKSGVAKGLFHGEFVADWVFPYPKLPDDQRPVVEAAVSEVTRFCEEHLDPVRIDREADIPREVIDGLSRLGVLGMTAPRELGGQGFSQMGYGRILEVIGGRCSSTAIFVNAHHSIGMRALLLFGSDEQKRKWLPDLVSGRKLAAFALTEPEAGSDAANVRTTATPSADGSHYVLNGEKRYITNGSIANVLTVMARTPVPGKADGAITAFLVTPDMPGFQVTEARMEKLGIRGTATARLAFENMAVPRENILGPLGKGLKVALTVLDFGRTTFGSCCTGAAKTCLKLAIDHARTRRQFGRSLGEFELVQQKLARMAGWTYAMEAMTTVTAGLIDRGLEDYMLETAMLKVWSTERLWTIVNDAFQIHGGAAYFTDRPLERMLRDHRINQIGEGANEVLLSFIALSGMRGPGLKLKAAQDELHHPWSGVGAIAGFLGEQVRGRFQSPDVPVRSSELMPHAKRLGLLIRRFGRAVQQTLFRYREEVLERQLEQARIASAAMELFASACVLSRWDHDLAADDGAHSAAAHWFVTDSLAQSDRSLDELHSPMDDSLLAAARQLLS